MWSTPIDDTTAPIEALFFEIPEAAGSDTMAATLRDRCQDLAIPVTTVDCWTDPDAVLAHQILPGPAIVLVGDGVEVARLAGPSSRRRIERFLDRAMVNRGQAPAMVAV